MPSVALPPDKPSGNIVIADRPDGTRLVSLSDTQYPFADEALVEAVEQFMKDWQPDDIMYNGDIADCVTPETRVLTYDLRWVPAGDLVEGDEIVGFDEEAPGQGADGRALPRKMRRSVVEKLGRMPQPVIALHMDDGTVLRSTAGHRWLGWKSTKNNAVACWMRTDEIAGRVAQGRPVLLNRPSVPWVEEGGYDGGYIAAAFDGEGHITFNYDANNFAHMAFSQRPGPFMDAVEAKVQAGGFRTRRTANNDNDVQTLQLSGGMWAFAEFIGRYRMPRFVKKWAEKAPVDGYQLRGTQRGRVVSAVYGGVQEIVRIQTSTKTYLAEGFCSHNCYELSDFDKDPRRRFNLKDELDMTIEFFDRHAALVPKARRVFIYGNHEDRLRRYIWKHAGEIAEIVPSLEQVMGLAERGIDFVTYGKHVDYLGFAFTHGNFVSAGSGMTARKHLAAYGSSGAHGHTHRLGSISKTDMNNRTHTFMEQGCLCRVDLEYNRGVADWQQGFLVGEVFNGALHPQLIHVIESRGRRGFVAGGNYYRVEKA